MQTTIYRIGFNICAAVCLLLLFLIFTDRGISLPTLPSIDLQTFKTLFLSIILEAFPFVLLGVVVSALLQVFVSEETIQRFIPKNPVLGILFACLMGIIFPLCECGMIPVVRRLMNKGMPVYIAIVFILVGPIINPVVYASTYMAFRGRPEIAYSRMGLAFAAAVIIGLVIYRYGKIAQPLRSANSGGLSGHGQTRHHRHEHIHPHLHANSHSRPGQPQAHTLDGHGHSHAHGGRLSGLLSHASDEFFEMGKYLMFGAILAALIQTFVNRESLVSVGQGPIVSHLFMMGFAYVLSLCSTSDAFVASSFSTTFTAGSLLTFLVFGPMLDIKSTLMLLSVFRTRFVLLLFPLVAAVVLAGSLVFERFVLH